MRQSPQTNQGRQGSQLTRLLPGPLTPTERHRQRYMAALGRFVKHMSALSRMIRHRYRSDEASETIDAHLSMIEDIRGVASARDILGQIIEERVLGTIKPPQLELRVDAAIKALFAAAQIENDWPALLIEVTEQVAGMADPYDSARGDITRMPTGSYLVIVGYSAAMPTASHSNSLASLALPETSSKVTRSSRGKLSRHSGSAAMTA